MLQNSDYDLFLSDRISKLAKPVFKRNPDFVKFESTFINLLNYCFRIPTITYCAGIWSQCAVAGAKRDASTSI